MPASVQHTSGPKFGGRPWVTATPAPNRIATENLRVDFGVSAHSPRLSGVTRAAPLPPDERREAILDAVLPLVLEHGPATSTRRIAEACGVAEGTIFRVFATKQELLDEVVGRALSPDRVLKLLASLPSDGDLAARVSGMVATLQDHATTIQRLMPSLQAHRDLEHTTHKHPKPAHGENGVTVQAIAAALAPFAGSLSVPPSTAASAIFALSLGSSFTGSGPTDPDLITDILLHGIAQPDQKA